MKINIDLKRLSCGGEDVTQDCLGNQTGGLCKQFVYEIAKINI
jgi:hypothetical protein